ncbi:MAG: hypothetical protein K0R82_808 [Flavipsychrobacter sp.]|nr:hypothetical protein [Flavipsychrobacter sp.]
MTGKPLFLFAAWAFCMPMLLTAGEEPRASTYGFIENKGQVVDQDYNPNTVVKYLLNTAGLNVQLRKGGFSYDAYTADQPEITPGQRRHMKTDMPQPVYHFHRIDITFEGANPAAEMVAEQPAADYLNYYIAVGEFSNIKHFGRVIYKNLYNGIDLEFVTAANKPVEYNFIVHPGADASQIKMHYEGANKTQLENGRINISLAQGMMYESIPASYIASTNKKVDVAYQSYGNNTFGYHTGTYDKTKTLIIDPVPDIGWGTYYGGGSDDEGRQVEVRGSDVYITGSTASVYNIATAAAHQPSLAGTTDGYLARFNTAGVRQWATFYGGSNIDVALALAVSSAGDLYIAGQTRSTNGISTPLSHQAAHAGGSDPHDGFLAKFSSSGVRDWATYYGGTGIEYLTSAATDASGNVFVCGTTSSTSGIASGGHQNIYGGWTGDGMLIKFNSSGVRQWATYAGGSSLDEANSVAVDPSGNVVLYGFTNTTSSNNLASASAWQYYFGGGLSDYFLAKYSTTGVRSWSTFFGGSGDETRIEGRKVATDASGNIYIVGGTTSDLDIATPGTFQPTISNTYDDAFLVKFNTAGSRVWGTYFGVSGGEELLNGVVTDASGDVYVSGFTNTPSGLATPNAYSTGMSGPTGVFFGKFTSTGHRTYSSYYGGGGAEDAFGISIDANLNVYITGSTTSNTFGISTPGAHQLSFGGANSDAYLARFNVCALPALTANMSITDVSCYGLSDGIITVNITNGTAPYQYKLNAGNYQPSNVMGGLAAGYYTVAIADDQGCKNVFNTTVAQPVALTKPTLTGTTVTEVNKTETYSTNSQQPGVTIQWLATGGTVTNGQGTTQAQVVWNTLGQGELKVRAVSGACVDSAVNPIWIWPTSVNDVSNESGIRIYPNPATDKLYITAQQPLAAAIKLYDGLGKLVMEQPLQQTQGLDISWLPAGVYNISVGSWRGKVTKL